MRRPWVDARTTSPRSETAAEVHVCCGDDRAPSLPDLLIAAVAELNQRTVLHLDKDFDLIADLTGQPMERLRVE